MAGYQTWRKLGFQVKKGSKGLPIFRPIRVKAKDKENEKENENETLSEIGEDGLKLIGFDVTYVFDISQVAATEDKDLDGQRAKVAEYLAKREQGRNYCLELQGGNEAMAGELLSWAQLSHPVEIKEMQGNCKGRTDGHRITIKADMSPAQTIKTLLHELAHCRLNHVGSSKGRDVKEIEAEATAFIAASHLGLDTGSYSFDYLASWGRDLLEQKDGVKQFRETVETIIEEGRKMTEEFWRFFGEAEILEGVWAVEAAA